jgi:transcriptional regulator with XRE-family HTH domain
VPGLRRKEVAALAGVSVDYYNRLERGNLSGVSDTVMEAIARALQLDEAERIHLYDLARAANPTPRSRRPARRPQIRPSVQRVLAGMTEVPAIVRNGRLDILAASRLGYALHSPAYEDPARPANLARFAFLDPRSREFYPDWDGAAKSWWRCCELKPAEIGMIAGCLIFVGELSTRSEDFRVRWGTHNVGRHQTGRKQFHHPVVGHLSLTL